MLGPRIQADKEYPILRDIQEDAFPLFLTTRQYLRMLDGTLSEPFFPRRENGNLALEDEFERDYDGVDESVKLDKNNDNGKSEENNGDDGRVNSIFRISNGRQSVTGIRRILVTYHVSPLPLQRIVGAAYNVVLWAQITSPSC